MAFLLARRASFRRLASAEFHQMLFLLRSDFHVGQAASYDLVILNEPCLPAHQCLLLRKALVLVVKLVYLVIVRVRRHTISCTCDEHFETF